jgi:hypothetical protein
LVTNFGLTLDLPSFIPAQEPEVRFAAILPTLLPTDDRVKFAEASLKSLAKTVTEGLDEKPLLFIVFKGGPAGTVARSQTFPQFETQIVPQPAELKSNDSAFAWALTHITSNIPSVTHLFQLCDDWLYNPRWLPELQSLVRRRPGAKAWWVYRSAYEEIHKTLRVDGDILVRSVNGMGCITREEWKDWGFDYRRCPRDTHLEGGISLDLLHPQRRPGERWVTARSYIVNVGLTGVCQRPDTPDFAVDFIGLEDLPAPVASETRIIPTLAAAIQEDLEPFNMTVELPDGYRLTLKLTRRQNVSAEANPR